MRMEKNPLRVLDCKIDKCKELTKDAPSNNRFSYRRRKKSL